MQSDNSPRTRRANRTDAEVIAALRKSGGKIGLAARQLEMDRSGLHKRIKRSAKLTSEIYDLEQTLTDAAEMVVAQAIMNQNLKAAQWYLDRKGRTRGYLIREANLAYSDEFLEALVQDVSKLYGVDGLIALRHLIANAPETN